jgi:hypothetical protein
MQYTADQIKKNYDKASKQVQDVLSSIDTSDKLVTIGENHGLSPEQIEDLIDEFGLLVLSFTLPNWFEQNITERLMIGETDARAIAKDIRDGILRNISLSPQTNITASGSDWFKQSWIVTESDKVLAKRIHDGLRKNPQQKLRDLVANANKTTATDETGKIIQERFAILPREIAQAITSPHFEGNLEFIRNKNGLLIDKSVAIQNEALLLIMGFIEPKDFLGNLSGALNIPFAEGNLIARDIYQRSIEPIVNSLIAFGRIREADEGKTVTPTKIESVSMRGPDVVVQTSTRVALDDLTGAGIPTVPSKNTNEFIPTLAQKSAPQAFPSASAPQKMGGSSSGASTLPPIASKPVSTSAMVMPKTPEAAAAMKPSVPSNITTPPPAPIAQNKAPEITVKPVAPQSAVAPAVKMPPPKMPEVSTALAAEISNLLKKSPTPPAGNVATPQTITSKIAAIAQSSEKPAASPAAPIAPAPVSISQASSPSPSYAVPIQTAPATPLTPADKLSGMMQKPRAEIVITKKAPDGGSGDPYREPVS